MNASTEKRRWPWGMIVLTVSLALNLLFVGAMAGAGLMRGHHGFHHDGPPDFIIQRMLKPLPEEKRKSILAELEKHRKWLEPKFEEIHRQRQVFNDALHAQPFVADNVRKATEKLMSLRNELEVNKANLLVNVLSQLSQDERQQLLKSRFFRRMLGARR